MFLEADERPAVQNLLIVFADLIGFRRYCERSTDLEQFELIHAFVTRSHRAAEGACGRLLKSMGDAVLLVFPANGADEAAVAMVKFRSEVERWLREEGTGLGIRLKMHLGSAVIGYLGEGTARGLDIIGSAVNVAATLPAAHLSATAEVFRKLSPETRRMFKKHTPPYYYISLEEPHRE